jgi:hypothetical protein
MQEHSSCVCYAFGVKTKIKPINGMCYAKLIVQISGGQVA